MTAAYEFRAAADAAPAGLRLDHYLAAQPAVAAAGLTRSQVQRLIAEGQASVNGAPARPAQKVRPGDLVRLLVPPPAPSGVPPQPIPLSVAYEDESLVVVDKPAGLAVHPGPGHPDGTLVNGLLALCPDIQGLGGEIRPGIVHRLDKDTSGLLMAAKTAQAHSALSAQLKERRVTKGYLGLAAGRVTPPQGSIDAPIGRHPRQRTRMAVTAGGRESRTDYRVLHQYAATGTATGPGRNTGAGQDDAAALLELYLHTGRTHQIRVHLAWLGHPLVGDAVYGRPSPRLPRHFLHAHHLAFQHPQTGETIELRAPLPPDLQAALDMLDALAVGGLADG